MSNSAAPEPRLVPLGDAAGRTRWLVEDGEHTYAVFADDPDRVRVVDASCPHRGGPLVEGVLRDGAVVCPMHWYTFDLDSGRCRNANHAGIEDLRVHPVVHREDVAYAEIVDRPPPLTWAERLRAHARGEA